MKASDKYLYGKNNRYFAQIVDGLESIGAAELEECGAVDVKTVYRGIYFSADRSCLYRIVYSARCCGRILAPLVTFDCHSPQDLYKQAREICWEDFLGLDMTFAIGATVAHSRITHSQYAALKLKDAIVDRFRDRTGSRPSIDTKNPAVQFVLRVERNVAHISLDLTRVAAFKRGYRVRTVETPMQETVAAAIIKMTGWQGECPLYDPMCGSGTILAEAYLHCADIPAGLLRAEAGVRALPGYQEIIWDRIVETMRTHIKPCPSGVIAGSDIDANAVAVSRTNLSRIPGGRSIPVTKADFNELSGIERGIIVVNPPYGIRRGDPEKAAALYTRFGDFLKQKCTGCTAYIYAGEPSLLKHVGLKHSWKRPLKNGGLAGALAKYELY